MELCAITTCPCCGASNWKPHKYTATTSYFECLSCHYYVQIKEGAVDKVAQFEAEQKKFYDDSSLVFSPGYSLVNAEITRRRMAIIGRFLAPGSSIVEVGPGAGDLIVTLAQRGYVATAVEHSAALAARLREKKKVSVIVGDFDDQRLPEAAYDAYCSFHVVEHIVDVRRHLRLARNCVKPGGYAFIATPNSRGWEHQLPFRLSPNYDSSHFQLFSAKALGLLLQETGWETASIITPSYSIAWLRIITKVLRKAKGQDEDTTGGHYARSASGQLTLAVSVFSAITKPLRLLQEALSSGNELLVVARRML